MVGAGTQVNMISYMYIVPELQAGNIHTGWNILSYMQAGNILSYMQAGNILSYTQAGNILSYMYTQAGWELELQVGMRKEACVHCSIVASSGHHNGSRWASRCSPVPQHACIPGSPRYSKNCTVCVEN